MNKCNIYAKLKTIWMTESSLGKSHYDTKNQAQLVKHDLSNMTDEIRQCTIE